MSAQPHRQRLDDALVARGLVPSRARARDCITRGCVTVDGDRARKAGQLVTSKASLTVEDDAAGYVSRAALKLIAALDQFDIDVSGRQALDVGASTGGFTQVLLERGARSVIALDVGHDQLNDTVRSDARVLALEGVNARDLKVDDLPYVPNLITVDVSFISQCLILPALSRIAGPDAILVSLVKPQFESDASRIGKGGVITDRAEQQLAVDRVTGALGEQGWTITGPIAAPIAGGKGNQEFLLAAWKGGSLRHMSR